MLTILRIVLNKHRVRFQAIFIGSTRVTFLQKTSLIINQFLVFLRASGFKRELVLITILVSVCGASLYFLSQASEPLNSSAEKDRQLAALTRQTADLRINSAELQYWQLRRLSEYQNIGLQALNVDSQAQIEYAIRLKTLLRLLQDISDSPLQSYFHNSASATLDTLAIAVAELELQGKILYVFLDANQADYQTLLKSPQYKAHIAASIAVNEAALAVDANVRAAALRLQQESFDASRSWGNLTQASLISAIVLALFLGLLLILTLRKVVHLVSQLRHTAGTDPLTGLLNRRALEQAVPLRFAQALREHTPLSLLVIDLDFFKQYNDTHGHSSGDLLLAQCAELWRQHLRGADVVARIGGEEFVWILGQCTAQQAYEKVNQLQAQMPQSQTISAGIAQWWPGESYEDWFDRGDQALYAAKTQGRARAVIAPPGPTEHRILAQNETLMH